MRLPHLPVVPVTDLAIHPRDNDLVIATHGRSLCRLLDDITPLSALTADVLASDVHLFAARAATVQMQWKYRELQCPARVFRQTLPPER